MNGMKAQILSTATLLVVSCGTLPAVDPRLLNLVMPDAKVLAGVNVTQIKASPFGQYLLSQIQSQSGLDQLATLTGFDPRQDINELLAASDAAASGQQGGLALATGTFNVATITAFVAAQNKAVTETYGGVTILEDPKQTHGIAFLSGSLAVAGDVADVKAAIDRQTTPTPLPAAVIVQVNALSSAEDVWVLSTVPPSSLHPPSNTPAIPGLGTGAQGALSNIQQASAGVKFGANVALTIQAQADNAQDATTIVGVLQLLVNMAQLQAQQNASIAALAQSLAVTSAGTTVTISASLPEAQFQQLLQKPHADAAHSHMHRQN